MRGSAPPPAPVWELCPQYKTGREPGSHCMITLKIEIKEV